MAAPMEIKVIPGEYYELKRLPETVPHPHPPLRDLKIMTVSETRTEEGVSLVVCKWPSVEQFAFFFESRSHVLPTFDKECTLTIDEATGLINRRIDPVDLCFSYGKSKTDWLHVQEMGNLTELMREIGPHNRNEQDKNHFKLDQLYAINYTALPDKIREAIGNNVRVAKAVGIADDPENVGFSVVGVKIPSNDSLDTFFSSGSENQLPVFDRGFSFKGICARLFFVRVLPEELCLRLSSRRDFWVDEVQEAIYGCASGDSGGDYAFASGDADADDASSHVSDDAYTRDVEVDDASVRTRADA